MATMRVPASSAAGRTSIQKTALAVGIVFLLVGILGFIPGATTHYSDLSFAGHDSGAMLLGVFQVSILHNIVHLLFGVAGVALARTAAGARNYLVWGGAVYLVLWLYGMFVNPVSTANFIPVNAADNWLHFLLGAVMVGLGLALGRHPHDTSTHI